MGYYVGEVPKMENRAFLELIGAATRTGGEGWYPPTGGSNVMPPEGVKPATLKCAYCGTKNDATRDTCKACGAPA